jgi:drug/metabolite transporter (DMT)-like permease
VSIFWRGDALVALSSVENSEQRVVTKNTALPYLWMLAGSLAFATMGALAHALGSSCDWQAIAVARAFMPLVFMATIALAGGTPLVLWRPRTLWMRSIAGSVSMVGTFFALTRLPVSDVFTLTNMFPIWIALLSWRLLRERPAPAVWISVVSGVVGVVLLQQPHFAEGNFATLVALASSLSTALAMIGLHRVKGIDVKAIVVHFSGVALVFCLASFFLFDRTMNLEESLSGQSLLLLLALGICATIGQLFLTKAFTVGSPAKVSVVGLTQIVFGMAFDMLWWHRTFTAWTLFAMVLVIAPTAWLLTQGAMGTDLPPTPP